MTSAKKNDDYFTNNDADLVSIASPKGSSQHNTDQLDFLAHNANNKKSYFLPYKSDKKIEISGINIIGDSLSDNGKKNGKYKKKVLGIPFRWFLHKSPHDQFTNGFVWTYPLIEKLEFELKQASSFNPLYNHRYSQDALFFGENKAEGGATAYNYGGFFNLFRMFFKGFFLSFFLNNIQKQAHDLKKQDKTKGKSIKKNDLNLIFAGANDLITVGYCDAGGASRAIQGIERTIEILRPDSKNFVLFTLPDFSKTPRFRKKSEQKKKQAKQTCQLFNQKLRNLAATYRYIDFNFCDIYQVATTKEIDSSVDKIKDKGIIIVGKGNARSIYFVDKKELVSKQDLIEPRVTEVVLSKLQQKSLGEGQGKVKRTQENTIVLSELIQQLSNKAKLNADVKVFDAAAVFEEIDENPEVYGFTSGCAIYYSNDTRDLNALSLNSIVGNAVLLKQIGLDTVELCFFQNGQRLETKDKTAETVKLSLSKAAQAELVRKLAGSLEKSLVELTGAEGKHDLWSMNIIQNAVSAYETAFERKIRLADISTSILAAINEHLPDQKRVFWDDLHPTVTVHFLLELVFGKFFMGKYKLQGARQWLDDTALQQAEDAKFKPPFKSYEAPASIRWQGQGGRF